MELLVTAELDSWCVARCANGSSVVPGGIQHPHLHALGWSPAPLEQALTSYADWLCEPMIANTAK